MREISHNFRSSKVTHWYCGCASLVLWACLTGTARPHGYCTYFILGLTGDYTHYLLHSIFCKTTFCFTLARFPVGRFPVKKATTKNTVGEDEGRRETLGTFCFCYCRSIRFRMVLCGPNSEWLIFKTSIFSSTTVPPPPPPPEF